MSCTEKMCFWGGYTKALRYLNPFTFSQNAELREADLERNNGVYYSERLQPVPADSAATLATGVKRSADKARIPLICALNHTPCPNCRYRRAARALWPRVSSAPLRRRPSPLICALNHILNPELMR